ncbi:MAG: efflux RND transporter permease subunit [Deltaproteobacteria bacterium]|nr:efflux RND transporter permease subunit [Deltaproteobacteria bacterium]
MARNSVAANLAAATLIFGGIVVGLQTKQEVFPEFDLDMVTIGVVYPGASPSEVEQGILLAVEEAVRGLDGVKKVTSTAIEGAGSVLVELLDGTDQNKALADIKAAVDRIVTFPEDAERPVVSLVSNRHEVIDLVIYGDVDEKTLRHLADRTRDDLLAYPNITYVELGGVRKLEIDINVPQENLRAHGLTLEQIAFQVRQGAVELPGGGVKTKGGEVLLRTAERRDLGREFEDITVLSNSTGARVRLADIADIKDGFEDTDVSAEFYGKPAAMVNVFRIGDQTPMDVASSVKEYIADVKGSLPPGVGISIWRDWSEVYQQRVSLLLRNAAWGLMLVLLTLGLFLEIRLAFWVTFGIPLSFIGSLLFLPAMDVTINMLSLFAFIVTLGMVVDDAIVVGENVYLLKRQGMPPIEAAIKGARQMAMPVTFAVLTTVAAFAPLLFVSGIMGKFMRVIPIIVISVLTISLIESFFVLPAHLGHLKAVKGRGLWVLLNKHQQRFSRYLEWVIKKTYAPVLERAVRNRYVTLAIALAILIATAGFIKGGHIDMTFMPKVDSDVVSANAVLPFGAPIEHTRKVRDRLVKAAKAVIAKNGGEKLLRGLYTQVGASLNSAGHAGPSNVIEGSHLAGVQVFMVPSDDRAITAEEFARKWRERVGEIPGLENLTFKYTAGPSGGASIDVQLIHPDIHVLERAGADLAAALATYDGVQDIDDGFEEGKPQLDFRVRPTARALGITATDLGRQVRSAFYGAEALRQQRGRDEVRVMVRLPQSERRTEQDVEDLLIRTPGGGEIPLFQAASVKRGRAYTAIRRTDGRRTVDVTADTVQGKADPQKVLRELEKQTIPDLIKRYPGLTYRLEGEQRERAESLASLKSGFLFALVLIFALLAIPFRSYIQPVVVMSAIPFGLVGAVIGHLLMGFDLSIISMMGIVALSGVVVNDSLLMVNTINEYRNDRGMDLHEAVLQAGVRRFRPILLTSVTTFLGLAPMIFETSIQARFLLPMAISLGYGIMFATFITLLLVPALYLMVEDIRGFFGVGGPTAS